MLEDGLEGGSFPCEPDDEQRRETSGEGELVKGEGRYSRGSTVKISVIKSRASGDMCFSGGNSYWLSLIRLNEDEQRNEMGDQVSPRRK